MIDFRQQPPKYNQGIYDIPFEQYRLIPALNSSKLKKMKKSPLHFKTAIETPEETQTAQMQRIFDKGTAFDRYVLEGGKETLDRIVAIEPDLNRNTKLYQDWKKQQSGKLILTSKEKQAVIEMAQAAQKKTRFSELFSNGFPHRVIIWQDQKTGLWCKAEIDWITSDGVVVDLKSTSDADFWFFSRNARKLGYCNQGAHYLDGLTQVTGFQHSEFRLAAVEVDPPYESHVYKPSSDQMFHAQEENEERMIMIKNCLDTDKWPGYLDEVIDLDRGQYLINYDEEEGEETYGF